METFADESGVGGNRRDRGNTDIHLVVAVPTRVRAHNLGTRWTFLKAFLSCPLSFLDGVYNLERKHPHLTPLISTLNDPGPGRANCHTRDSLSRVRQKQQAPDDTPAREQAPATK